MDTKNLERMVREIRNRPATREKILVLVKKNPTLFGRRYKMPSYMELAVLAQSLPPSDAQIVLALATELQQQKYRLAKIAVDIASLPRNGQDVAVQIIGDAVQLAF